MECIEVCNCKRNAACRNIHEDMHDLVLISLVDVYISHSDMLKQAKMFLFVFKVTHNWTHFRMLAHESNFFSNIQDFGYCCEMPCLWMSCLKQNNGILCSELGYKTRLIMFKCYSFKDNENLWHLYAILWILSNENCISGNKCAYFEVSFVFSTNLPTALDSPFQKT